MMRLLVLCHQKTAQAVTSPPLFREGSPLLICRQSFGTKRVTQKRRHMMKILQPMQEPYKPKPADYQPIPLSVLGSGPLRRVINTNSAEAFALAKSLDWDKYKCNVRGVRWHPNGSWRVQFTRRNYEHNFHVKVNCYFRVGLYGFDGAKQLALGYRKRLEAEWDELLNTWNVTDRKCAQSRLAARRRRNIADEITAAEPETTSTNNTTDSDELRKHTTSIQF
eukprot:GHVS01071507.1.p1 GENE.GHVS01071507.1~~GHVS01071507.1.p1  ORF type:complete len:222 (+),score=22.42 GHVS01071507.1:58-723(+)